MSKIKLTPKTSPETRILDYLESNASDTLIEKINAGKKTLAGAVSYARSEAKKIAAGESSVCIDDETVFGWVIHFFEESDIVEEKAKPAIRTPGAQQAVLATPPPAAKAPAISMLDDILM